MTETKPFNGRSCFQPVYSTKKSTSCCSRQLSQRKKLVSSSSNYTVQRHGGATEACSQSDRRCGSSKQEDFCDTAAIQGGQPRDLLCSSSAIRTEEGGRKNQQIVHVSYKLDEFVYLPHVMNSVYDKIFANQPICNVFRIVIATIYYNHLFFLFESGRVGTLEII